MEKKLLEALQHRYATKRFDPVKKLNGEQLDTLIEALRMTATSYGLQLMKLVIVEDKALRKRLVDFSYGQRQVEDASHLFVLCREKKLHADLFESHVGNIAETRQIPVEKLESRKQSMMNSILNLSSEEQVIWLQNQVYIPLANLLTACAVIEVDACPMEGFQPEEYDKLLGLNELNLASVLVVPVGFRSVDDTYAAVKKVRRSPDQFVVRI